jgi:peptide/nickel transport system substrate-binding protein
LLANVLMSRRLALRSAVMLAAARVFHVQGAHASSRISYGGKVSLRIPWPLGSIDPHRLEDASAAIFSPALFDSLYAIDEQGALVPNLAETEPEFVEGTIRIKLRDGLRTATGKTLDARDVLFSIERARKLSCKAALSELPQTWLEKGGISLRTPKGKDAVDSVQLARIARILASPLTAIVPKSFDADRPDGTGPFRLTRRGDGWALVRNRYAASGPAYLDDIALFEAESLSASLRAFEAGTDDIGWLGLGLHESRPQAKPFDLGAVAYAVLRTGKDAGGAAGAWDAPGNAQQLCNALPHARLSYLSLGAPWPSEREQGWGGGAAQVLYREDGPWLAELARAVAATLSRPGHELSVKSLPEAELRTLRATRNYALMIDVVRPLDASPVGIFMALGTADNAETLAGSMARLPKLAANASPRTMTRLLRLGVIGEIRIQGGRVPDVVLPPLVGGQGGLDFGSITRKTRAS